MFVTELVLWNLLQVYLAQIRCFPYVELSDVLRLQQVEQKAVGRQRNLGLAPSFFFNFGNPSR
jgi:hypothetical protein